MHYRQLPHTVQQADKTVTNQFQRLAQKNEIRVIGYKATGCSPVDDPTRGRTGIGIGKHVRHHVMAQLTFVASRGIPVDVVQVVSHLLKLLARDRQP